MIDDNEVHYLKVMCNELFGRSNFVATCVLEKDKGGRCDADKWFKPAKGQSQLFYKQGAIHLECQPDFVAETKNAVYMLEPKASNQMKDATVLAKKEVAIKWCKNASDYAAANGGKPWCYVLIPIPRLR